MNHKRNSAVLCLIAGAGLLAASFYIHGQVAEGREQISSAQKKVDQSNSLFSVSPYTKGVGNALTGSAQKKIDAGSAEAAHYEEMANMLKFGGFGLLILGAIIFVLSRKRS